MIEAFGVGCAAFLLSLGLTPLFRKVALRTGFLDTPQGQLKKHTAPVPYLGGLAVYFAFLLAVQGAQVFLPGHELGKLHAVLAGGTVVLLLGLLDDLFSYTAGPKFLVQIAAALVLALFGVRLEFTAVSWAAWVLTVFWVVAVTNALNLVDIMDGLAAALGIVACFGFLFVPLAGEEAYVNIAAAALGGALLGFLPYNWQPAKIYLGDTGALFAGFVLAAAAMGQSYSQKHSLALLAPLLILAVPLYDTLLVMVLRFLKGRPVFQGSNDHAALRLRFLGLRVPTVVGMLTVTAVFMTAGAWGLVRLSEKRALFLLVAVVLFFLTVTLFLAPLPVDQSYGRGWGNWRGGRKAPRSKNREKAP